MNDKPQLVAALQEEFGRWEALLAGLTEAQITAPRYADNWSVKDIVAHLWVWQQRSAARLEGGLHNKSPHYPDWPAEFDPEIEAQPHELNRWLYESNRDRPWRAVYADWRAGFLRLLELAESLPEDQLLERGRYHWLEGYSLADVLLGSLEHHQEHWGWLLEGLGGAASALPPD
jgi:hypothetical protein